MKRKRISVAIPNPPPYSIILQEAILNHVKIQVSPNTLAIAGSNTFPDFSTLISRPFSAHLTKDQVTDRIISVLKDFPKVDPSKVSLLPFDLLLPFYEVDDDDMMMIMIYSSNFSGIIKHSSLFFQL